MPIVMRSEYRVWMVEEAVDMIPPAKLTRVDVETPAKVVEVVKGYAKVAAPNVAAERQVVLIA